MKKYIFLLLVLSTLSLSAQEKTRFRKIDSLLTYLNENNRFMGQLSIREGDNVVFSKAYGLPNQKQNPPDGNSKYKIGSITKTFTAVMIMQLVEEKRLKLDTKLSKFYPKIPNAEKITMNDLLRHRSGIRDYVNADSTTNMMQKITKKEMLDKISGYEPVFAPNTKAEYSNSNYYILGCIIEDLTKVDYKTNLKKRILDKVPLRNTYMVDQVESARNEVISYTFENDHWKEFPQWDMSLPFAAGGITSNANDLTALMRGIFNGKLLKPSSVDEMTKIVDSYGIGLVTFPFGERKFYGHTGGIEGYKSVVGYYPTEKLGVSLIVNGDNYNRNDIMIGILSIYYKMPYPFPNLKSVKVDEKILNSYSGMYSSSEIPLKINIRVENGQLVAQATGQSAFPLNATSEKTFVFDSAGVEMTFENKKMILKQGGMEISFTKE